MCHQRELDDEKVHEINTYEQLRELDHDSDHLQSDVIQLISRVFSCEESAITDIRSLKRHDESFFYISM